MHHLQDATFSRIDQVCRLTFASDNAARPFDCGNQRLEAKFSVVTYFDDAECRGDRSRCIEKFLVTRKIDVVQTRTGHKRVGYSSAVTDIETYNMITTSHE